MDHHIDHHFDEALEALKERIRWMASKVEQMLSDAIRALKNKDVSLAEEVRKRDREIDDLEMALDEQCLELLARYQPAAQDLRFISRGLKIATDLERVGDLAHNTAKRVLEIAKEGEPPIDLTEMSLQVQGMLRDSIAAFIDSDVEKAEKVLNKDDQIDSVTERFVTDLVDRSMKTPQHLKKYFPSASIVRYLERIADHATNIAEVTIFVAKGRDVRHGHLHEKKRA